MGEPIVAPVAVLWRRLRLPRRRDGSVDSDRLRSLMVTHFPMVLPLLVLLWLTERGVAHGALEVTLGTASVVPLWITSKSWQLPWWVQAGAASFPLSIALIAAFHGDATGLARGAKFAYGALFFIGIVAWASTPVRRLALSLALIGVILFGFALSWSLWLRSAQSPSSLMRGTLEWHNQFAGHMAMGFALAVVLATIGVGRWMIASAVTASVLAGAVLASGSRYGSLLTAGAMAVALIIAIFLAIRRRDWMPAMRLLLIAAGAVLALVVIRVPVLVRTGGSFLDLFGALGSRGNPEGSVNSRFDWWIASAQMGADHPFFGIGLLRFQDVVWCYGVRPQWHPHNEWAYAWAEGGAIGLIPVLLIPVGIALLTVVAARVLNRDKEAGLLADPGRWAAALALTVGVAHLLTEYDLFYLVLVALLAASGAIAIAPTGVRRPSTPLSRTTWIVIWTGVMTVVIWAVIADSSLAELPWRLAYVRECRA